VLDRADQVAASWRSRYDRLRLNTSRQLSHLPGRRFPKGTPLFPSRDQYVAYLQEQAAALDVRLRTAAQRIDQAEQGWVVHTSSGDYQAAQVVLATGFENQPYIPDWLGRDKYEGPIVHSSAYRNPTPYEGKSALVVGPGCSGMEIAYDLASGGASRVWLAVRTPPNILLRQSPGPVPGDWLGVPLLHAPRRFADWFTRLGQRSDLGDLSPYGLPFPDEGVFARLDRLGVEPTIVDREVIEAVKERRIEVVAGVESLDDSGVELADGSRLEPEAIVCATGYRRHLEPLVGHLGVLDPAGRPRSTGTEPAAPGLWFVGFVPRPAALGAMGKEGKRVARRIAQLRGSPR